MPATQRTSPQQKSPRPYYSTKAEWARAKLAEVRERIARISDGAYIASSDWRAIREKQSTLSTLRNEEAAWRRRVNQYVATNQ
ncbi:MAG: hypothetical protein A2579_12360 [Lysobacterales bacterium RIFOXYD1_FULL_69_11]|nr:MAG: hypothetical protein A2579_12360 [Xanthomonadales bacterium RIFOXYD1_FULL_69_11]